MPKHPVFIVGWDGATFDLMRPWVAEGKLPTIAKIMADGSHGPLRSTIPPMTFTAWTSFMTGKNPGKHGIYDFTRRKPGSYDLEFVNGSQRKAATFWHILSQAGLNVISVSVPCTFPPEKVKGIMISGFDAPGFRGGFVDPRGMYPQEIHEELNKNIGTHPIGAFISEDLTKGRPDLGLEKMLETIKNKTATIKYLMTHKPWDCAMMLFGESDGVGHHFWKYCDPKSPLFTEQPAGLRDAILKVYQELDRQTGELLKLMPPETNVLMMSDHGFGGVSDWVLYPNCWVREKGFLKFKGGMWKSRMMDAAKLRAVGILPDVVKKMMFRFGRGKLGQYEAKVRYGFIDWENTEAYFEENPYYPVLWINLKGREPKGIVTPERYEEVRSKLIAELESWRHPDTGERIVEKAYRREEVYSGAVLEEAADIIVKWGLHKNYNYSFRLSSKSKNLAWAERIDPHQPQNLPFYHGKSGHHRDDGIFLAYGPDVRPGHTVTGARIIDLAPTLLHLLGVSIPNDMDGKVLEDIFTEDHARGSMVQWSAEAAPEYRNGDGGADGTYSSEDEALINERLKSLGYVE